ncbi:MAG: rhomboid family intramembrane serine protease [Candidatus Micrarchaeota archaeon]
MIITLALLLLCIAAFLFQDPWMLQNFSLISGLTFSEPWRLVTSMFLHADFMHLLFNMFALLMFGLYLERKVGRTWFLIIYLASGIIGGLGFQAFSAPGDMAIGASGAIFGIIGALVVLEPKMTVYVYLIPLPIAVAGILYALIEVVGMGQVDNIAHSAHLLGLAGGFIVAKIYENTAGDGKWS